MSRVTSPWGPRLLALGATVLVNAILAMAILRLVTPAAPELGGREPVDLGPFVRVPRLPPPPEPIEGMARPETPPAPEPVSLAAESRLADRRDHDQPPAPGPLQVPVVDPRIRPGAGGAGPWLGEFRPAAEGEGRGESGYDSGLAGGDTGTGAWLPVLPSVRMHPEYPFLARRRGIEGHVLVTFTITPEGRTSGMEILESRPPGVFDDSVRRAVRDWRFSIDEHRELANRRWQYRVVFSLKDE